MREDTYGTPTALGRSLDSLKTAFAAEGCNQVFIKPLAPNDNSKNQIYLASDPDKLRGIPRSDWEVHELKSRKATASNKKILRANIPFNWLLPNGGTAPAPTANLIFYPQYPEVRFSGFLQGSAVNASKWMQPQKAGRSHGRYLLWGVSPTKGSFAYLAVPDSQISKALSLEVDQEGFRPIGNPNVDLTLFGSNENHEIKTQIMQRLAEIYDGNPHAGSILKKGEIFSHTGRNAGGTTLESLFGIEANGNAGPDYLGWELKGHSQPVITMLTPQPDGGFYKDRGVIEFTQKYGYPDKNGKAGRTNFSGIHKVGTVSLRSLELQLIGVNDIEKAQFRADGYLGLIDMRGSVAASWSFTKLLNHWQTKHANTAFVEFERSGNSFHFGHEIQIGEGASFGNLLRSFATQAVYYDPALKVELSNDSIRSKARNQFRVHEKNLAPLFDKFTEVDVRKIS